MLIDPAADSLPIASKRDEHSQQVQSDDNTSLAHFALAFRQAKVAMAAERDSVGLEAFARFELDMPQRVAVLQAKLQAHKWFHGVPIGAICVCPKSTSSDSPAAAEDQDVVRIGTSTRHQLSVSVRLLLEPTPEFSMVEVLYLWKFGAALEALLDGSCVGYRLKRVNRGHQMDRFSRGVYEFWPQAFARYRDEPIEAASAALQRGERLMIVSTDIASFFDSIDPSFMLTREFLARLKLTASQNEIVFDAADYYDATSSLLARYADYRNLRKTLGAFDEPQRGIPIGSLVSRVIANVALAGFDRHVQAVPGVSLYRRYVDDIVIVRTVQEPLTRDQLLRETFPEYLKSDKQTDDTFAAPEIGSRFSIKRSKTRIHDLAGPTGIDFLDAVRKSFSAVSSERRAFVGDVERLTSEIQGLDLFEDGTEGLSRIPRLRDADRFTLKRYISSSLVKGLERCALLLTKGEANNHLEIHSQRLLAVVDADAHIEDFNLVLDLLRVALMSDSQGVAHNLDNWLAQRAIEMTARALKFTWKEQVLLEKETAQAIERYLERRIYEAKARACSWIGAAPRSDEGLGKLALLLRQADLRHLDRESDFQVFGAPDPGSETCLFQLNAPLVRHKLQAIESFLERARVLQIPCWMNVSAVSLLLSVKPPSYTDVSRLLLTHALEHSTNQQIGHEIDQCVDAMRGTQYALRAPTITLQQTSDRLTTVKLEGKNTHTIRVILSSLPVSKEAFSEAIAGTPILSLSRLIALDRALRDARDASRRAQGNKSLVLLPELAVPQRWVRALMEFANRERLAMIAGVEYSRTASERLVNQAVGLFPLQRKAATAALLWTKRHPARGEAMALRTAGRSFPEATRAPRFVVDGPYGRLGVLICSELLEAAALAALSGGIELLCVPAWNDDTGSFDHAAHAAASALVHSFVCVSNNAEASDSRVVGPVREPRHERDWCRVIHRGESRVVWADLPIEHLRRFHNDDQANADGVSEATKDSRTFRPLPPGWPKQTRE